MMDIYLRKINKKKGRGVFAGKDFKVDDIIEINPVLIFNDEDELDFLYTTKLVNYMYVWTGEKDSALALGLLSFLNHSYNPNANYLKDFRKKIIILESLKDIKKGQEITINYNGDPFNKTRNFDF